MPNIKSAKKRVKVIEKKTLRNNIKNFFKDESNLIETFNRANIDLNARAEEISVSDFYILFNALS